MSGSKEKAKLIQGKYPPKIPLTRQQINQCRMDIEDAYPLRSMVEAPMILPLFNKCFKKKRNFRLELKSALLKKLEIKVPKTDIMMQQDPYILLGFGINSYFDLLWSLSMMMAVITVFSIPIYYIYGGGHAY